MEMAKAKHGKQINGKVAAAIILSRKTPERKQTGLVSYKSDWYKGKSDNGLRSRLKRTEIKTYASKIARPKSRQA